MTAFVILAALAVAVWVPPQGQVAVLLVLVLGVVLLTEARRR